MFDPNTTTTYTNFTNTYEPSAAGGAVFQQTLTYEPGQQFGSSFSQYDPLNQQSYSDYQNFYLANGQVALQTGLYDTGTYAGGSWATTYDTAGNQPYSYFQNISNASNQVVYQSGGYDQGQYSGDSWVSVYTSPGNTAHYDQTIYNPSGGVVAHIVV